MVSGADGTACARILPHLRALRQFPCVTNLIQSVYVSARVHGQRVIDAQDLECCITMGLAHLIGMREQVCNVMAMQPLIQDEATAAHAQEEQQDHGQEADD